MSPTAATATKNYQVAIAGISYRLPGAEENSVGTLVAVKGEVVALDGKEAERLERLGAVAETDLPTSALARAEAIPVEHAKEQESKEEHAAKARKAASKGDAGE